MAALLPGLSFESTTTPRLRINAIVDDRSDGQVVLFVHGNVSSSIFWQESILALPVGFRGIAVDLRGFGKSEPAPVDASRGLRDFADDVASYLDAHNIDSAHLVGWSMGGGVVMQMMLDHTARVASAVLVNPVSPFGFGGTTDVQGTRIADDDPGCGGTGANPEFVAAVRAKDTGDALANSPRNVLNTFYFAGGFRSEMEDAFVESMITTVVDDDNYPGDGTTSDNWPGFAPGRRGVLNTMAPMFHNTSGIVNLADKPKVLWVRGANDQIVSDESLFDLATLGKLGAVPGWPGEDVAPSQPMVSQTRHVLQAYAAAGGAFVEVTLDAGHTPQVEQAEAFNTALAEHLRG